MKLIDWRKLGWCLAISALVGDLAAASQRSDTLRHISAGIIARDYQSAADLAGALDAAVDELARTPDLESLRKAQSCWRAAYLGWRRISWLESGPLSELEMTHQIAFWQTRPNSIQSLLRRPGVKFTDEFMNSLGATTTGFFAIEYVLFCDNDRVVVPAPPAAVLKKLTGPAGGVRLDYLRALARQLAVRMKTLAGAWSPDAGGYATKFAEGGQVTINLVVENRLKPAISLNPKAITDIRFYEGAPGGVSQSAPLALVRGTRDICLGRGGPGFAAVLSKMKAPLADRLAPAFDKAEESIRQLGSALETAPKDKISAAYEEVRRLEVLLKTELVGSLGVTLTFLSGDGD